MVVGSDSSHGQIGLTSVGNDASGPSITSTGSDSGSGSGSGGGLLEDVGVPVLLAGGVLVALVAGGD